VNSRRFEDTRTASGPSPTLLMVRRLSAAASIATSASGTLKPGDSCVHLRGHTADIRALVFTPDGRTLASGSEDRTIRLWNPKTGEPTKLLFTRYDHNVCSLSLSPDGLMLASRQSQ
jgi:WD40 repeat protein